jgi:hypothetical protein
VPVPFLFCFTLFFVLRSASTTRTGYEPQRIPHARPRRRVRNPHLDHFALTAVSSSVPRARVPRGYAAGECSKEPALAPMRRALNTSVSLATRPNCSHNIEFSFLNGNFIVPRQVIH